MRELIDYDIKTKKFISKDINMRIKQQNSVGYNAPLQVEIENTSGFLKYTVNTSGTVDLFEFILSKFGKMLNVKTADEYLVRDDEKIYLYSKSVLDDGDQLITFNKLIEELDKNGMIFPEEKESQKRFKESLDKISTNNYTLSLIQNKSDIKKVIDIFPHAISKRSLSNKNEIIRDYVRMCLFDCITGNKDRSDNNYGLIKKQDGSYEFSPLFDSATIGMPNVPDNYIGINGYLIDRLDLYNYLKENYYNYVDDIVDNNKDEIKKDLEEMSNKVLDDDKKEWLFGFLDGYFNMKSKGSI